MKMGNDQSAGVTYRALPDDWDFETRHAAVGWAAILNRRLDYFEPTVVAVDEQDREFIGVVNQKIESGVKW